MSGYGPDRNKYGPRCRRCGELPTRFKYAGPKVQDIDERFWRFVDTSGGPDACWPWIGGAARNGYGVFGTRGTALVVASRFIVERTTGVQLKDDEVVMHLCDNPPCVNVRHLRVGNYSLNAQDAVRKGRMRGNRRLTENDVREIRRAPHSTREAVRLGARYGVTQSSIWRIWKRTTWRNVG